MIGVHNGIHCISSLKVAEYFGKNHKEVLRDIKVAISEFPTNKVSGLEIEADLRESNLEISTGLMGSNLNISAKLRTSISDIGPDLARSISPELLTENMFFESTCKDKYGREQPCYLLSEAGFNWIALSYRGKKQMRLNGKSLTSSCS